MTSFAPVGLVTDVPMTIIARKDFEPNTLAELIDYAKANADKRAARQRRDRRGVASLRHAVHARARRAR